MKTRITSGKFHRVVLRKKDVNDYGKEYVHLIESNTIPEALEIANTQWPHLKNSADIVSVTVDAIFSNVITKEDE